MVDTDDGAAAEEDEIVLVDGIFVVDVALLPFAAMDVSVLSWVLNVKDDTPSKPEKLPRFTLFISIFGLSSLAFTGPPLE